MFRTMLSKTAAIRDMSKRMSPSKFTPAPSIKQASHLQDSVHKETHNKFYVD